MWDVPREFDVQSYGGLHEAYSLGLFRMRLDVCCRGAILIGGLIDNSPAARYALTAVLRGLIGKETFGTKWKVTKEISGG